ncbi:MAG: hypothetical protein FWE69_08240, partial [Clostridiales bacterium]|nr:hypothetical protein [Clostridiales bacterium]
GAALAKEIGDGNFVCAPFSVWLPLAALANATDARYQDELLTALGASDLDAAELNETASRLLYDLTNTDRAEWVECDHNPLQIVNAIFVRQSATLYREFAQTFADCYRGAVMGVDFLSPDAVDEVNRWANENTEGLIPEIVREFHPNTIAALVNAIYFSDRWDWEFDPDETEEDVFHAPAGDSEAWFMRRGGDGQIYYEDERLQATSLSFKTGGGLYILLPKDGNATGLLSSLTNETFESILTKAVPATGELLLPRFSIEHNVAGLEEALIDMGVPLFDPIATPLNRLAEGKALSVSQVIQKAKIAVDEKGTTAAAVTVIVMVDSAPFFEETKPFIMRCDKPFVFILYGDTHDGGAQVLFTGIVNRP